MNKLIITAVIYNSTKIVKQYVAIYKYLNTATYLSYKVWQNKVYI